MLVCYDECLPGEYAQFDKAPAADFAWAALVCAQQTSLPGFALVRGGSPTVAGREAELTLPHGLQVLRFLLNPAQATWSPASQSGLAWTWERLHG